MGKQWIISISREYGSGGHKIAEKLSEIFDFPMYDRELLDNVFGDEANVEEWRECDEMPAPLAFSKKFPVRRILQSIHWRSGSLII